MSESLTALTNAVADLKTKVAASTAETTALVAKIAALEAQIAAAPNEGPAVAALAGEVVTQTGSLDAATAAAVAAVPAG